MLTSFFKKSQERSSFSSQTPHASHNFHHATDRKRKASSEVVSVVEKQQVRQDGMICKIWSFLVYLVFEVTIDRKKAPFLKHANKAQAQRLIFLQVADKTRKEMNVAFGQRLSEIVTDSASISEPPKTSTQSIAVNEIVYKSKLAYVERLSKAKMNIEKSFHANAMVKIQTISEVRKEILNVLTENRHDVYKEMKDIFTRQFRFGLLDQGLRGISITATSALMQDIVERCSLSEMYRNQISQLRLKLALKEDSIRELQQDLANKNLQHQLPEVALQLAAVIEKKSEKSGKLVSIISDLLVNNIKDTKRWNDDTKSLFAIILDYGGPALLKIIKEQIGGPSLQTCYATARSEIPTPTKLEEGIFGKAASFYDRIGYKGPFILAIDATAILPSLRVTGNKVIGVASEEEVFVHPAQDIIEVTHSETTEKARLANAFVLTPSKNMCRAMSLRFHP